VNRKVASLSGTEFFQKSNRSPIAPAAGYHSHKSPTQTMWGETVIFEALHKKSSKFKIIFS
jgi:hypothetical protein